MLIDRCDASEERGKKEGGEAIIGVVLVAKPREWLSSTKYDVIFAERLAISCGELWKNTDNVTIIGSFSTFTTRSVELRSEKRI